MKVLHASFGHIFRNVIEDIAYSPAQPEFISAEFITVSALSGRFLYRVRATGKSFTTTDARLRHHFSAKKVRPTGLLKGTDSTETLPIRHVLAVLFMVYLGLMGFLYSLYFHFLSMFDRWMTYITVVVKSSLRKEPQKIIAAPLS